MATIEDTRPITEHAASLPAERLEAEIVQRAGGLARRTYELLVLIGELDARGTWKLWGALSCAGWLAEAADVDLATAHTQVRVARAMREHPELARALADRSISYAKARVLTPQLTQENATALIEIATQVIAAELGRAIAAWSRRNEHPDDIDQRQHENRSVRWRTDPDGMVTLTARLQPHIAGQVVAAIDQSVMSDSAPAGATLAHQRADALHTIATRGGATLTTEVVIHVDETGQHLPDGTPLSAHPVAALLDDAFVSLLIHDTQRHPIDASPRRRLPTRRQRRVIQARQPTCAETGCTCTTLLQIDHLIPHPHGGDTVLTNLTQRCGPHNRQKSQAS